jgi:hypothetical protein
MQRFLTHGIALLSALTCVCVAGVSASPHTRQVRTEDRNGDGRPDVWQQDDDDGKPSEVRIDTNFDGRADVQQYYVHGTLVRRESDRNFDNRIDLVEEFDPATHDRIRSVVDCDYDGTADLLILFHEGRPVFSKQVPSLAVGVRLPGETSDRDDRLESRRDDQHLAPLTDPFRAETSLRGPEARSSSPAGASLSTPRDLPCSRFGISSPLPRTARLIASDARAVETVRLRLRSPRGPPLA